MTRQLVAGTVLARLSDLPDGSVRVVDLAGDEFPPITALLAREGDLVHAYLNRCPHAGRPLNFGPSCTTPDGELLQCHAHGALFEKVTGLCIAGPCVDDSLRRLQVTVVEGEVRLAEELDINLLSRGPW
ncbi:MAG: Rieske 2Fe-2S domain-containing protein [Pseudomonadota bacterium]|nr:Rieske 2Fe-2S domain-containing protein [Pseudomonadota bacterium]